MKLLKLVLATIAFTFSFSANSVQYTFVAGDNDPGTMICIAAVENSVLKYHRKLDKYHVSRRFAANKLRCNEQNLVAFAKRYNALKTAYAISKYRKNYVVIRMTEVEAKLPLLHTASKNIIIEVRAAR